MSNIFLPRVPHLARATRNEFTPDTFVLALFGPGFFLDLAYSHEPERRIRELRSEGRIITSWMKIWGPVSEEEARAFKLGFLRRWHATSPSPVPSPVLVSAPSAPWLDGSPRFYRH